MRRIDQEPYAFTVPPVWAARIEKSAEIASFVIACSVWIACVVALAHLVAKAYGIV